MKRRISLYSFLLLLSMTSAAAERPRADGPMLAHTCAACHGTHGRIDDSAFVPLAGMHKDAFVRAMTDFRAQRRPSTLMHNVANGFSDADIEAMGEFFAAQSPE